MNDMKLEMVRELASLAGVDTHYDDIWGHRIQADEETLAGVLQAMGYADLSTQGLPEAIREIRKEIDFPIPPVISSRNGAGTLIPAAGWLRGILTLRGEEGMGSRFEWGGTGPLEYRLPGEFPRGYYRMEGEFSTSTGEIRFSSLLVYAPEKCWPAPADRIWGTTVAAYSLYTGKKEWIGDLRDLRDAVEVMERNGAGFVGLLPLHLLENRLPFGISPYYPLDRLLWNPVYLPLDEVAGYFEWPDFFPGRLLRSSTGPDTEPGLVDYETAWREKRAFLEKVFERFYQTERRRTTARWQDFQTFLAGEGDRGWMRAFFHTYREQEQKSWRDWPALFRDRDRTAIREWIAGNEQDVLFHSWLQWLTEKFLGEVGQEQNILGFDLPIGSSPEGSECWLNQELFASGARVGAPPDDFSPQGQNWGFLPVNPWIDRKQEYSHFRALLQKNMRFSRFLRIDHIMGLYRSFWIPEKSSTGRGTYVRQFSKDLFAILALESERNRVTIIGEDLGTVPPRVRELMDESGVLCTKVFYFEQDEKGFPLPPDHYPRQAFITMNTHDMPTLRAFCAGSDLTLRRELGIFDESTCERLLRERGEFLKRVIDRLRDWGFLQEIPEGDLYPILFSALLRYLAATECRIRVVSLEDVMRLDLQPNLPSTTIPENWRHRVNVGDSAFSEQVRKVHETMREKSTFIQTP
ncbi:MAG TPA: 4-alpha-glucanotransferase [Atribacteraceae bacterium]|nr:4-alpha-glucanotransferase [Atribacteraceae bacterium]